MNTIHDRPNAAMTQRYPVPRRPEEDAVALRGHTRAGAVTKARARGLRWEPRRLLPSACSRACATSPSGTGDGSHFLSVPESDARTGEKGYVNFEEALHLAVVAMHGNECNAPGQSLTTSGVNARHPEPRLPMLAVVRLQWRLGSTFPRERTANFVLCNAARCGS